MHKIWAELINLGNFSVLRDACIREQLGILKEAINYKYARIALTLHPTENTAAFFEEAQALDCLRALNLTPWLVLPIDRDTPNMPWSAIDLIALSTGSVEKRYGFIYVDCNNTGEGTYERICKDSFDWYKKVIASSGEDLA